MRAASLDWAERVCLASSLWPERWLVAWVEPPRISPRLALADLFRSALI